MHGVTRRISEGGARAPRGRRCASGGRSRCAVSSRRMGTLLPHEVKSDRHLVSGLVRTARRPRARPPSSAPLDLAPRRAHDSARAHRSCDDARRTARTALARSIHSRKIEELAARAAVRSISSRSRRSRHRLCSLHGTPSSETYIAEGATLAPTSAPPQTQRPQSSHLQLLARLEGLQRRTGPPRPRDPRCIPAEIRRKINTLRSRVSTRRGPAQSPRSTIRSSCGSCRRNTVRSEGGNRDAADLSVRVRARRVRRRHPRAQAPTKSTGP